MWDYEGYWGVVIGYERDAEGAVAEFGLTAEPEIGPSSIDEWLGQAEAEAWREGAEETGPLPVEWSEHHQLARAELMAAAVS